MELYPKRCSRNVRLVATELMVDAETAYAMLLLEATLMDLKPEDPETADMVIADAGPVVA